MQKLYLIPIFIGSMFVSHNLYGSELGRQTAVFKMLKQENLVRAIQLVNELEKLSNQELSELNSGFNRSNIDYSSALESTDWLPFGLLYALVKSGITKDELRIIKLELQGLLNGTRGGSV